jgi:hypothetical protein
MGGNQDTFKTANKDLRFLATTGSMGYHGAAHMTTNADTSLLAAMQAKLSATEDDYATALTHHKIPPTASVATTASNVSVKMPITSAPSDAVTVGHIAPL